MKHQESLEKRRHLPPLLLQRARQMRRDLAAPAELRLWSCVRNRQLNGFKFRRQQTIGPYIVDFYCSECRLIVELDGDSHSEREDYDEKRSAWLNMAGYKVVRYPNTEIFENLVAVLEDILRICETRAVRNSNDSPSP